MNKYYPNLFSPVRIGKHTLRSRLLAAPLWDDNSFPLGQELQRISLDYYEERARGGFAMVSPGDFPVNHEDAGYSITGRYHFYEPVPMRAELAMRELVRRIKRHGALAEAEFTHLGYKDFKPSLGYAIGPVGFTRDDGVLVVGMTEAMMDKVCGDFAKCALRAKELGFDAVLIHGGHGWLITQFLSPRDNRRTDRYGGSVENRARFPKMILERVRQAVGDEMLIELRISAAEDPDAYEAFRRAIPGLSAFKRWDEPGITLEETIEFCKIIDGLPDIIHVSGGNHTDSTFVPSYLPNGCHVPEAEAIKKALKKSYVSVVGGINDPDFAEEIIASGKADFVSMARQSIADPYFPQKAMERRAQDINSCLRCGGICVNCSVNPVHVGYEHDTHTRLTPAETPRKVVVVGGGPGGMKAAETAAARGHEVVLFEKEAVLGGKLRFSALDSNKVDIDRFLKNLIKRTKLNPKIDLRLSTEATPELVACEEPYAVIAAVGANFVEPSFPRAEGVEITDVVDAFLNFDRLGERVVIMGAGTSGCDAALDFALKGKKVTLLGRNSAICKGMPDGMGGSPVAAIRRMLDERGVTIHTGCACTEITPNAVSARFADGGEITVEYDSLVSAMGETENIDLAESFRGDYPFFRSIGDCRQVGLIGAAIYDAYYAALDI